MVPLVQMFQDSSGPFAEGEKGGGGGGGYAQDLVGADFCTCQTNIKG